MTDIVLPEVDLLIHFHDIQVAKFGGSEGLRDRSLLESAVGRVGNAMAYMEEMDVVDCASMLAHSILKNHAFVDGNKRTAFGVVEMMTRHAGYELTATDDEIVEAFVGFAAGHDGHEVMSSWLRERIYHPELQAGDGVSLH